MTFPQFRLLPDPSFDGEAARRKALIRLRVLADHFEEEDRAMRKTNTDYAVVHDGEIGWSLMTPRPFISSAAMSSCQTIHATRGETKVRNPLRCSFSGMAQAREEPIRACPGSAWTVEALVAFEGGNC